MGLSKKDLKRLMRIEGATIQTDSLKARKIKLPKERRKKPEPTGLRKGMRIYSPESGNGTIVWYSIQTGYSIQYDEYEKGAVVTEFDKDTEEYRRLWLGQKAGLKIGRNVLMVDNENVKPGGKR